MRQTRSKERYAAFAKTHQWLNTLVTSAVSLRAFNYVGCPDGSGQLKVKSVGDPS